MWDLNPQALGNEFQELHGRRLRVNFAQEKPRPSFGGGEYGGGGGGYRGPGGYGGRNQNAGGGGDFFGGGLRAASGGSLNHDLSGNDGRNEFEDDDYANTSNK